MFPWTHVAENVVCVLYFAFAYLLIFCCWKAKCWFYKKHLFIIYLEKNKTLQAFSLQPPLLITFPENFQLTDFV